MSKASTLVFLRQKGFPVPDLKAYTSGLSAAEIVNDVASHFENSQYLAVRSSASIEDGREKSYAGQFESAIAVTPENLEREIERVKGSMPGHEKDEVLVQSFISGEFSGVLFSDSGKDTAYIEALPGLCKPVVEGADCQQWKCESGKCAMTRQPENLEGLFLENNQLMSKSVTPIPAGFSFDPLLKYAKQIEEHLGNGIDIEWTYSKGEFYILQARPISRSLWDSNTTYALYDSANVGESYSGIVSPLTLGFARKLYEMVYRDLMTHSATPSGKVEKHRSYFEELVEGVYGRMYYRMENWYRMMAFLPGYRRNKRNLENMLQLNISEEVDTKHLHPSWWQQLIYYPLVVIKFFQLSGKLEQLAEDVDRLLAEHRSTDLQKWNEKQCKQSIEGLFEGVLRKWYLTVENDTVMMTLFARIKRSSEESMQRAMAFHSEATEQINALARLSQSVLSIPELKKAVREKDRSAFFSTLNENPELAQQWNSYRRQFGGRFANELKLETPSFDDDFDKVCQALMHFYEISRIEEKQEERPKGWVERNFQKFASRRERFRLLRANMFDVVRQLIVRLGELYAKRDWIHAKRDIFYLDWEDVMNGSNQSQWKRIVAERKMEYAYFESLQPPAFFKVIDGQWPTFSVDEQNEKELHGMSASKGVITGKVKVIEDFEMPEEIDFDILVTRRTDPGWTPLIALSKGLIVEHGGILSHAAIVARELNKPTLIGVKGACSMLNSGDVVRLDAQKGLVVKLEAVSE